MKLLTIGFARIQLAVSQNQDSSKPVAFTAHAVYADAMVAAVATGPSASTRLAAWAMRALRTGSPALSKMSTPTDGLISFHRHAFLDDPAFQRAYQRGVRAIGGQD